MVRTLRTRVLLSVAIGFASVAGAAASGLREAILRTRPAAYWSMDEPERSAFVDSAVGTPSLAPDPATGLPGCNPLSACRLAVDPTLNNPAVVFNEGTRGLWFGERSAQVWYAATLASGTTAGNGTDPRVAQILNPGPNVSFAFEAWFRPYPVKTPLPVGVPMQDFFGGFFLTVNNFERYGYGAFFGVGMNRAPATPPYQVSGQFCGSFNVPEQGFVQGQWVQLLGVFDAGSMLHTLFVNGRPMTSCDNNCYEPASRSTDFPQCACDLRRTMLLQNATYTRAPAVAFPNKAPRLIVGSQVIPSGLPSYSYLSGSVAHMTMYVFPSTPPSALPSPVPFADPGCPTPAAIPPDPDRDRDLWGMQSVAVNSPSTPPSPRFFSAASSPTSPSPSPTPTPSVNPNQWQWPSALDLVLRRTQAFLSDLPPVVAGQWACQNTSIAGSFGGRPACRVQCDDPSDIATNADLFVWKPDRTAPAFASTVWMGWWTGTWVWPDVAPASPWIAPEAASPTCGSPFQSGYRSRHTPFGAHVEALVTFVLRNVSVAYLESVVSAAAPRDVNSVAASPFPAHFVNYLTVVVAAEIADLLVLPDTTRLRLVLTSATLVRPSANPDPPPRATWIPALYDLSFTLTILANQPHPNLNAPAMMSVEALAGMLASWWRRPEQALVGNWFVFADPATPPSVSFYHECIGGAKLIHCPTVDAVATVDFIVSFAGPGMLLVLIVHTMACRRCRTKHLEDEARDESGDARNGMDRAADGGDVPRRLPPRRRSSVTTVSLFFDSFLPSLLLAKTGLTIGLAVNASRVEMHGPMILLALALVLPLLMRSRLLVAQLSDFLAHIHPIVLGSSGARPAPLLDASSLNRDDASSGPADASSDDNPHRYRSPRLDVESLESSSRPELTPTASNLPSGSSGPRVRFDPTSVPPLRSSEEQSGSVDVFPALPSRGTSTDVSAAAPARYHVEVPRSDDAEMAQAIARELALRLAEEIQGGLPIVRRGVQFGSQPTEDEGTGVPDVILSGSGSDNVDDDRFLHPDDAALAEAVRAASRSPSASSSSSSSGSRTSTQSNERTSSGHTTTTSSSRTSSPSPSSSSSSSSSSSTAPAVVVSTTSSDTTRSSHPSSRSQSITVVRMTSVDSSTASLRSVSFLPDVAAESEPAAPNRRMRLCRWCPEGPVWNPIPHLWCRIPPQIASDPYFYVFILQHRTLVLMLLGFSIIQWSLQRVLHSRLLGVAATTATYRASRSAVNERTRAEDFVPRLVEDLCLLAGLLWMLHDGPDVTCDLTDSWVRPGGWGVRCLFVGQGAAVLGNLLACLLALGALSFTENLLGAFLGPYRRWADGESVFSRLRSLARV